MSEQTAESTGKAAKASAKAAPTETAEPDLSGLEGKDNNEIVVLTKDDQEFECVVEAAPVWLARGWTLKTDET
jgi:hypothetical protein